MSNNGRRIQKWTRLTKRRVYWIEVLASHIIRLAIKIALTIEYNKMFNLLGLDLGIGATILAWLTSYWLASKLFAFVIYRFMPENVQNQIYPWQADQKPAIYGIIGAISQLLFHTTDENKESS